MPLADCGTSEFATLLKDFQVRLDNYVPLIHVKLDWLEGTGDPTKTRFNLVAGLGLSSEQFLAGGKSFSPFGEQLAPEFVLSSWYDKSGRFYPNRRCKHWVTIRGGSVKNAMATWQTFRSTAVMAGDAVLKLGLRPAIADPLQRWLIVLHDTIKPERSCAGEISKVDPADEPLPESVRLGDMQITTDRMGVAVIDDLHEASCKACETLAWVGSGQTKTDNNIASAATASSFIGGKELREALGVHPTQFAAFDQQLSRKRSQLGDDNFKEVKNTRARDPKFLYRVESQAVRDLAEPYKVPKSS